MKRLNGRRNGVGGTGSSSRKMRDSRDLRKQKFWAATITAKLLQRGGHRLTVVTQAVAIQ